MDSKLHLMKNEIQIISKYQALIVSKYYITAILLLISFYLGIKHMAASSLYILIMLNALPPILSYILKEHAKNSNHGLLNSFVQDIPFQLSFLKSKYHYSKINYLTNSTAYSTMILLICFWQINYYNENVNRFLCRVPLLTIITGLTLRFSAVIFYRFKISYDLMNNKI